MTIEEVLVKQYGPLLSLAELAMILDRSPEGLRISLRSSGEWVSRINSLVCGSVAASISVLQKLQTS
jgi:hypothetical protein